jgi:hypothetical protein
MIQVLGNTVLADGAPLQPRPQRTHYVPGWQRRTDRVLHCPPANDNGVPFDEGHFIRQSALGFE